MRHGQKKESHPNISHTFLQRTAAPKLAKQPLIAGFTLRKPCTREKAACRAVFLGCFSGVFFD